MSQQPSERSNAFAAQTNPALMSPLVIPAILENAEVFDGSTSAAHATVGQSTKDHALAARATTGTDGAAASTTGDSAQGFVPQDYAGTSGNSAERNPTGASAERETPQEHAATSGMTAYSEAAGERDGAPLDGALNNQGSGPVPHAGANGKNAPKRDNPADSTGGAGGGKADVDQHALDLLCARFPLTDLGNAERFAARYKNEFLFCPAIGWLHWDLKRWNATGAEASAMRAIHSTVRAIRDEAQALIDAGEDLVIEPGKDTKTGYIDPVMYSDKLLKWGRTSESNSKLVPILKHAAPYLEVLPHQLDANPMMLNVQNGTLHFDKSFKDHLKLLAHDPRSLITKICPIEYQPNALCPLFDAFMREVQPDEGVLRLLDQYGGLSLTGDVGEQILLFHFGKGRNGKGVYVETLTYVAGGYATSVGIETFLSQGTQRKGGDATPDLASLPGVRMLTTSEPEKGATLNEGVIKLVTGGDTMRVRHLNKDFFEFKPQFKLTMQGNYRPKIKGTDEGIWGRFQLVPWPVFIPPERRDKKLGEKLRAEGSGILNRLIDGLIDWMRNGLVLPDSVRQASENFREESDPLGRFLADCTQSTINRRVSATELFLLFAAWAKVNGETEWTMKGFGMAMRDRGIAAQKSSTVYWLDLEVTKHVSDFVDEHGKPRKDSDDGHFHE